MVTANSFLERLVTGEIAWCQDIRMIRDVVIKKGKVKSSLSNDV